MLRVPAFGLSATITSTWRGKPGEQTSRNAVERAHALLWCDQEATCSVGPLVTSSVFKVDLCQRQGGRRWSGATRAAEAASSRRRRRATASGRAWCCSGSSKQGIALTGEAAATPRAATWAAAAAAVRLPSGSAAGAGAAAWAAAATAWAAVAVAALAAVWTAR